MKIEIRRLDTEYPLVDVHVDITTDVDRPDLAEVLSKNRITLLGRWKPHTNKDGHILGVKAPALLEDEHVKPRKTARSRKR